MRKLEVGLQFLPSERLQIETMNAISNLSDDIRMGVSDGIQNIAGSELEKLSNTVNQFSNSISESKTHMSELSKSYTKGLTDMQKSFETSINQTSDMLNDWIKNDPSGTIVTLFLVFTVIIISLVLIAYLIDHKKNKQNLQRIFMLERAIKDLIEQFRAFELLFSDQKKTIQDYKYSLEKIDLEIARLADSSSGESKITLAIQMANQGKSISEISEATNLTTEEVEPIIKYHGKG